MRLSDKNQMFKNYNKRDRLIITYQYHSEVLKVPLENYYIVNHIFFFCLESNRDAQGRILSDS